MLRERLISFVRVNELHGTTDDARLHAEVGRMRNRGLRV